MRVNRKDYSMDIVSTIDQQFKFWQKQIINQLQEPAICSLGASRYCAIAGSCISFCLYPCQILNYLHPFRFLGRPLIVVVSHLESLNIDNALHFIKQELRVKYEMTGTACGREVYELPLDVIREAVIHAVKNMGTGIGKIRRLLEDAGAPEPLNEPLNELLRRMKAVPTITRHIQKLKPMKRLKRAGSDKTDYWEVL